MPCFGIMDVLFVLLQVASASLSAQYPCVDPLSSKSLSQAVDAAIVSLHGQNSWLHNLRTSTGYTHPIEVTTCTPKISMWSWPSATNADGLLARVLSSGKIRVAGVKWALPPAADYKTNPASPTGFWPEYMNAIAGAMSTHYGKTIIVERIYYSNSDLVTKAVRNGTDVEMSEPYYYVGGFLDNKPRIESMHISCLTVATSSVFSSTTASGIKSVDELYAKITQGPNRRVGFIGAGNYDAVSHLLPATVQPIYITDAATLDARVADGTLLAKYISEATASSSATRFVYASGLISPRAALFRLDSVDSCVAATALSAATGKKDDDDDDDDDKGIFMVVIVVLASVILLMTCLLTKIICLERSGQPMFMKPLMGQSSAQGQVIGGSSM